MCNSLDESGGNYAESKESQSKGYMLYVIYVCIVTYSTISLI